MSDSGRVLGDGRYAEPPEGANTRQVGGDHYSRHGVIQHWDIVEMFGLDYMQGQITKYVMRHKEKGGVQDLLKAKHFLEKYIEQQQAKGKHVATSGQVGTCFANGAKPPAPATGDGVVVDVAAPGAEDKPDELDNLR